MATVATIWKDAGTQADIRVTECVYALTKQLKPYQDSDGTNRWADDNRYVQQYQISGTVTKADEEDLRAAAKIVMGSTYPKLRVYDKNAADYYNDYSPVQITQLQTSRITHDEWGVVLTCQW